MCEQPTMTEDPSERHCRRHDPQWGPASLLLEAQHLLPKGGKALDIAMGSGPNAIYLATLGFQVTGIDLSAEAVALCRQRAAEQGVAVDAIVADLERTPLPRETYDLIVNFYYLQRDLAPQIIAALRPSGVLLFETYTLDQLRLDYGPRNPDFLLRPGELRQMFSGLEELFYREGIIVEGRGPKAVASLVARKPA